MTLSFDATRVVFGSYGQETARKMAETIKQSFNDKCQLVYNEKEKTFTIRGSKEISIETIEEALLKKYQGYAYRGWKPVVEKITDKEGNKIVSLAEVLLPDF